jgi:hypothetical protein
MCTADRYFCVFALCWLLQEWVERYKTNRAAAAAELMTLLVKVCCCSREWESEGVSAEECMHIQASDLGSVCMCLVCVFVSR